MLRRGLAALTIGGVPLLGSSFTPASLFAAEQGGAWLPSSDLSALFKSNFGESGSVAATDDSIGLSLDKRLMGTASVSAFIANQPELRGDGAPTIVGTATAATYNTVTGAATFARGIDANNQSYIAWIGQTTLRRIALQNTGANAVRVRGGNYGAASPVKDVAAGQTETILIMPGVGYLTTTATLNNVACACTVQSLKAVPGNFQSQSTANLRPKYNAGGYRQYDGADDCLVGTVKCVASGNSLAAKVRIPETIAATQVIAGMQASTSTRFFLAVNASGQLCGAVGSDSTTTIVGSTDIRGQTGVAMLIEDGANVRLYWNGALEYSGAKNGSPSTTPVIYEGALNNNGTAQSFFAGGVYDLVYKQSAFSAADRANLLNFWS